jgi:hypothetical protein
MDKLLARFAPEPTGTARATLGCRCFLSHGLLMTRGRLVIDEGRFSCEFPPLLGNNPRRAPVLHAGRTVMVTRYRLPIGLVPSTVAIEGDRTRVDASVLFRLPTLRTALREAGFEVVDRKVWFGLPGRGRGPASPPPVLLAFIALAGTFVAAGSQLGWW